MPQTSMPSVNGGGVGTETKLPRQRSMSLKLSDAAPTLDSYLSRSGFGTLDGSQRQHLARLAVLGDLEGLHAWPAGSHCSDLPIAQEIRQRTNRTTSVPLPSWATLPSDRLRTSLSCRIESRHQALLFVRDARPGVGSPGEGSALCPRPPGDSLQACGRDDS